MIIFSVHVRSGALPVDGRSKALGEVCNFTFSFPDNQQSLLIQHFGFEIMACYFRTTGSLEFNIKNEERERRNFLFFISAKQASPPNAINLSAHMQSPGRPVQANE